MYNNPGFQFNNQEDAAEYQSYFLNPDQDNLKHAFSGKMAVKSRFKAEPVVKEETEARYRALLADIHEPICLYIHVPFCKSKCLYCGFAGETPNDGLSRQYVDALIKEAEFLSGFENVRSAPVRVVYFGGGTPSALPPDALAAFMHTLKSNFNLANDCEITLESRVSDMVYAREFTAAGFSRFSLGVQSFNTKIRRTVGRLNTRDEVRDLLSGLMDLGKAAVIIDLIYGLPDQTVEDFMEDLRIAEEIGVDGLDTYQLSVFPGSRLAKAIEAGSVAKAADSTQLGAFYVAANEHLLGRHWRQLSNNHYSRTFHERNIYNSWVKDKRNFIAMGAGAGGCINGHSSYRMPKADKYMENMEQGRFTPDMLMSPNPNYRQWACATTQIEKGYFDYAQFCARCNLQTAPLQQVLENWRQCGLVTLDKGRLELTASGKFWYVNLSQAIINILSMQR